MRLHRGPSEDPSEEPLTASIIRPMLAPLTFNIAAWSTGQCLMGKHITSIPTNKRTGAPVVAAALEATAAVAVTEVVEAALLRTNLRPPRHKAHLRRHITQSRPRPVSTRAIGAAVVVAVAGQLEGQVAGEEEMAEALGAPLCPRSSRTAAATTRRSCPFHPGPSHPSPSHSGSSPSRPQFHRFFTHCTCSLSNVVLGEAKAQNRITCGRNCSSTGSL